MKKTFTRKEVKSLLKKQIKNVYERIARMPYDASDNEIMRKIITTKPIRFK